MRLRNSHHVGGTSHPDLIRTFLLTYLPMKTRLGKVKVPLHGEHFPHAVMQFEIRVIQANKTVK